MIQFSKNLKANFNIPADVNLKFDYELFSKQFMNNNKCKGIIQSLLEYKEILLHNDEEILLSECIEYYNDGNILKNILYSKASINSRYNGSADLVFYIISDEQIIFFKNILEKINKNLNILEK